MTAKIYFGNIKNQDSIYQESYNYALQRTKKFLRQNKNLANAPFSLFYILEKTLFEEEYFTYETQFVFKKYFLENPNAKIQNLKVLSSHGSFFTVRKNQIIHQNIKQKCTYKIYLDLLFAKLNVVYWLLVSLCYFCYKIIKNIKNTKKRVDHKNIFRCDGESNYLMWKKLFPKSRNTKIFLRPNTKIRIDGKQNSSSIINYGFSVNDAFFGLEIMFRALNLFLRSTLLNHPSKSKIFFKFYKNLLLGIYACPKASASYFYTFEHGSVPYAFRNILLKMQGSKSVFVPWNCFPSTHFYAPEYKMNYDFFCSPGQAFEMACTLQKQDCKNIFKSGPFNVHFFSKKTKKKEFGKTVTILFTGVADTTVSNEIDLAKLAQDLDKTNKFKIILRLKPFQIEEKFFNFYDDFFKNSKNIIYSPKNINLFDLLKRTDLFIAGSSTAATDILAAGGCVLCVNFNRKKNPEIWQTFEPKMSVDPANALIKIQKILSNQRSAARFRRLLKRASQKTAYRFKGFKEYRANFHGAIKKRLIPFYA